MTDPVFQAYTYLLQCADGTLYAGWTLDPAKRLLQHNNGTGAKYTRARRPVILLKVWAFSTRSNAMRWEIYLKRLSRRQKLALIDSTGPETIETLDSNVSL